MALSTFADGRLWGARYGAGPPWALALHGWGRDHHDFDPVLRDIDAVALDLPGFGVAPEPPTAWSTLEYARSIVPVLDEMAPGPVVVLGHSFGARVAVHLAGLAGPTAPRTTDAGPTAPRTTTAGPTAPRTTDAGPTAPRTTTAGPTAPRTTDAGPTATARGRRSIGALVLTGAPLAPAPGHQPKRIALGYRAGRAMHRAGLLSEERMAQLRRKYGSEDYRQATEVMRAVLVKAVAETARGAYTPVLRDWVSSGGALDLVWGERDLVAPLGGAEAVLSGPPEVIAKVTVVPGGGHLITGPMVGQLREAVVRHRPVA